MNFGELKTAVLVDGHRADLADQVARFVREGEAMIRRELRAYELSTTLDEDDRVDGGIYTLPSTLLEVRAIYSDDAPAGLAKVGLAEIRRLREDAPVLQYATRGNHIEFRGVPGTDAELELVYLGWPEPLDADEDTNDLLTLHEDIYKTAALRQLYLHEHDYESASAQFELFMDAVNKLNDAHGRKQGGASVAPAYNFGSGGSY